MKEIRLQIMAELPKIIISGEGQLSFKNTKGHYVEVSNTDTKDVIEVIVIDNDFSVLSHGIITLKDYLELLDNFDNNKMQELIIDKVSLVYELSHTY